jgi:hypothetical protein
MLVIRICFGVHGDPTGIHFPYTLPPSRIESHFGGPFGVNLQRHVPVLQDRTCSIQLPHFRSPIEQQKYQLPSCTSSLYSMRSNQQFTFHT